MRLLTAIAGAFLAALSLAPATASAAPEEPNMSPMIIGGSYAQNFPYAARLFFNGRENCSAKARADCRRFVSEIWQKTGSLSSRRGNSRRVWLDGRLTKEETRHTGGAEQVPQRHKDT